MCSSIAFGFVKSFDSGYCIGFWPIVCVGEWQVHTYGFVIAVECRIVCAWLNTCLLASVFLDRVYPLIAVFLESNSGDIPPSLVDLPSLGLDWDLIYCPVGVCDFSGGGCPSHCVGLLLILLLYTNC